MNLEQLKREWEETDPRMRWVFGAVVAVGVVWIGARMVSNSQQPVATNDEVAGHSVPGAPAPNGGVIRDRSALPVAPRNQGLEDLHKRLDQLEGQIHVLQADQARNSQDKPGVAAPASGAGGVRGKAVDLNAPIDPVDFGKDVQTPPGGQQPNVQPKGGADFGQPGAKQRESGSAQAATPPANQPSAATQPSEPPASHMKVWEDEADTAASEDQGARTGLVIPVNSALEGVMLTGINARPSGSVAGAVGSAVSANKVGAPFVTRLKGDATMPNGWKLGDLGDCFLGGSGVAVLSTERAYVISDNLSCIAANGDVYESPIKAYGVDVDGTLGLAGKVVSKQGSLLLQAALTGAASGLGAALAPTTISAYNTQATNGSTAGIQYPNPAAVGFTAVGQGVNQAASQLSKFYLEYAKEVFPVVEVVATTRVTWILQESIELHKRAGKVAMR